MDFTLSNEQQLVERSTREWAAQEVAPFIRENDRQHLFDRERILGGMALTRVRRYFFSVWFWAGVATALAIFLPNLVWQVRHDFISYHFLQHIHARDVGEGRADGFLKEQVIICINVFAAPLALAGLVLFLRDNRYRLLGWMYLIPLALFYFGKGRSYYLAAGAVDRANGRLRLFPLRVGLSIICLR